MAGGRDRSGHHIDPQSRKSVPPRICIYENDKTRPILFRGVRRSGYSIPRSIASPATQPSKGRLFLGGFA